MSKSIRIKLNKESGFSTTGYGVGKAILFDGHQLSVEKKQVNDVNLELKKFDNIVANVKENIKKLEEKSEIFSAHMLIASDPVFSSQVKDHIKANNVCVAYAIKVISDFYLKSFDTIYDPHLKERRADILDVTNQMLAIALDVELRSLANIDSDAIIFADDLSPSQTANLNPKFVKGIVLFQGGRTSHTAIIAGINNIPLVINNDITFSNFKDGAPTILDATNDKIYQYPTNEKIEHYEQLIEKEQERLANLDKYASKKTKTKDNHQVNLMVNIANLDDLDLVDNYHVDGVGLFRTEFLYMNNNLPSEDYQYDIYKRTLAKFPNNDVTIRTFDIGGDKLTSVINQPVEDNPFLGVRGIRLSLKHITIFKTQLRALLRASAFGNLKIMFPMIASINELEQAKKILSEVETELTNENIEIGNYQIGIMVEVPSVALNANLFAKHVDFFSIGSNDLIQYIFAADRLNPYLSYLYQPLNPGLINLISNVTNAAKANNVDISMCGEMAAYKKAIPLLIGLGINNLSMSASSLLETRRTISKFTLDSAKIAFNNVCEAASTKDAYKIMEEFYKQ